MYLQSFIITIQKKEEFNNQWSDCWIPLEIYWELGSDEQFSIL